MRSECIARQIVLFRSPRRTELEMDGSFSSVTGSIHSIRRTRDEKRLIKGEGERHGGGGRRRRRRYNIMTRISIGIRNHSQDTARIIVRRKGLHSTSLSIQGHQKRTPAAAGSRGEFRRCGNVHAKIVRHPIKSGLESQRVDIQNSSLHAFARGVRGDFRPESLVAQTLEGASRVGRLIDGVETVAVEGFFEFAEVVNGVFASVDGGKGGEEGDGRD